MNPYFIAGSVIAIVMAFGAGYLQGNESGQSKVMLQWEKEKSDMLSKHIEEADRFREHERQMQVEADRLRKEKDVEIRNLNARSAALANSLRERPSRPADVGQVPGSAGAGSSHCTARELYREDSEVVIGFAREADELRLALLQCYKQYNTAKALR